MVDHVPDEITYFQKVVESIPTNAYSVSESLAVKDAPPETDDGR
jgi:hypothetical protein